MSSAAEALERNATGTPPVSGVRINDKRALSLDQEQLVKGFVEAYGISRDDIYFDGNGVEPYFSYEAMSLLSLILSPEIANLATRPVEVSIPSGFVSANCEAVLTDGRARSAVAIAQVGEAMPGGDTVREINQALGLAQARAARRVLSMVGFNVVKAHEARKAGSDLTLTFKPEDPRVLELREAHLHGESLGWIVGEDKTVWREKIFDFTRGEFDSMSQMDDKTRGHWVIYLRALKRNFSARVGTTQS